MSQILAIVLNIALAIHIALIAVCVWRVWRGGNVIYRLIGADLGLSLIHISEPTRPY